MPAPRSTRLVWLSLSLAVALATALCGSSARAVQEADEHHRYDVDRRAETIASERPSSASALDRTPEWTSFLESHPGWVATWDRAHRVPARMMGPNASAARVSAGTETLARALAEQTLANAAAWIPAADLEFVHGRADHNGYWAHYRQQYQGVPVWNTHVAVRLSDAGFMEIRNRSVNELALDTTPLLDRANAARSALSGLPSSSRDRQATELWILPVDRGASTESRLVWKVELRDEAGPAGQWTAFVDARTGELLWRFNNLHTETVSGRVSAVLEPVTANGQTEERGLPYVSVVARANDAPIGQGSADVNGEYLAEVTGSTGRTLVSPLAGVFGRIYDIAQGQQTPSLLTPIPDGEPAEASVVFRAETDISARDAYYHAMVAHDHIQTIDASFHALDYPMPIAININSQCNAFWNGFGINFYSAGGPCPSTARVADVVYHEYGHGITDLQYRPFFPTGAMHEGFSDYYAATLTNQPLIGLGFFGQGTIIRRIDEDRVFPDDVVNESHSDGLIIAGALWDVREALGKAKADSLWHYARYGHGGNFDDYFFDYLRFDDNDGDVFNGTPDFNPVVSNFRKHGIGDYSIQVSHAPKQDTETAAEEISFLASFYSIFALQEGTTQLHVVQTNDADSVLATEVFPMTPTGGIREFSANLAGPGVGTKLRYWFSAADTSGGTVEYPEGGANDPFVFRIGVDQEAPQIDHDASEDIPADSPGLLLYADVHDNLDQPLQYVVAGWRVNGGAPESTDLTNIGDDTYRGTIPVAGLALGDLLEYSIVALDGATTPNQAADPAVGYHSVHLVRGFTRDFESGDGGFTGDHDWSHGVPTVPPAPFQAWSGTSVWATNLDGNYQDQTSSSLLSPPLDFSNFAAAGLSFHHALMCEPGYDGGSVEISTDGGTSWSLIAPDGDYDLPQVASSGQAGYSGGDGAWRLAEFDLFPYVGQSNCRIRWRFDSDQGVTGPGWYLDDISVVERQVRGRPLRLRTSSGDGVVGLAWDPPANVRESEPNPVTGYNLYRYSDELDEVVRMNPAPLTQRSFDDTDVQNGVTYFYWATAIYAAGESDYAGPVEGFASRPEISIDIKRLEAFADTGAVVDTSFAVRNDGTGVLESDIYVVGAEQSIDDVRIEWTIATPHPGAAREDAAHAPARPFARNNVGGRVDQAQFVERFRAMKRADQGQEHAVGQGLRAGGSEASAAAPAGDDWTTLFTDENEEVSPDLATFAVRADDTSLFFQITAHEAWGNPATGWNTVISLNTDLNIETGVNGGEYAIVAGPIVMAQFQTLAIVIYTGDGNFLPLGVPPHVVLAPGATEMEFGVPRAMLDSPTKAILTAQFTSPDFETTFDSAPDDSGLPWANADALHLSVPGATDSHFGLRFESAGLAYGDYSGNVLFASNDATDRVKTIPFTFHVQRSTPVELAALSARVAEDAVLVEWQTTAVLDVEGFLVFRQDVDDPSNTELRLTPALLPVTADGSYRFADRSAAADRVYAYRIAAVAGDGSSEYFGPVHIATSGLGRPTSLQLAPPFPNPANGEVSLRFGLPTAARVDLAVFGPDGRKVATLWAGPAPAGFAQVLWDGRDSEGRPVASGVYAIRLESGPTVRREKLIRLR